MFSKFNCVRRPHSTNQRMCKKMSEISHRCVMMSLIDHVFLKTLTKIPWRVVNKLQIHTYFPKSTTKTGMQMSSLILRFADYYYGGIKTGSPLSHSSGQIKFSLDNWQSSGIINKCRSAIEDWISFTFPAITLLLCLANEHVGRVPWEYLSTLKPVK